METISSSSIFPLASSLIRQPSGIPSDPERIMSLAVLPSNLYPFFHGGLLQAPVLLIPHRQAHMLPLLWSLV